MVRCLSKPTTPSPKTAVVLASSTFRIMAMIIVTKHFGFEEEWRATTELFSEYNKRPLEVPE